MDHQTAFRWFAAAVLTTVSLPITAGWLLTSNSPRQRALGMLLDRAGKVTFAIVIVVAGLAWLVGSVAY